MRSSSLRLSCEPFRLGAAASLLALFTAVAPLHTDEVRADVSMVSQVPGIWCQDAIIDRDGNIVMLGVSGDDSDNTFYLVVSATTPTGQLLWSRDIPKQDLHWTYWGRELIQDSQGDYVLAARAEHPVFGYGAYGVLGKLSPQGALLWSLQYLNSPAGSPPADIFETPTGYIIGEQSYAWDYGDLPGLMWVASSGGRINDYRYICDSSRVLYPGSYQWARSPEGGFMAIADIRPWQDPQGYIAVERISEALQLQWHRVLYLDHQEVREVLAVADGYVIAAVYHSTDYYHEYQSLFKIDSAAHLVWNRIYLDVPHLSISELTQDVDGGFLLSGQHGPTSSMAVTKVDAEGGLLWRMRVPDLTFANAAAAYGLGDHQYLLAGDGRIPGGPSRMTTVITSGHAGCGDISADGTTTDLADLIYLVNYIFKSGPISIFPPAADINGQPGLTSSDLIYGVNYLFKSGPAPVCP